MFLLGNLKCLAIFRFFNKRSFEEVNKVVRLQDEHDAACTVENDTATELQGKTVCFQFFVFIVSVSINTVVGIAPASYKKDRHRQTEKYWSL